MSRSTSLTVDHDRLAMYRGLLIKWLMYRGPAYLRLCGNRTRKCFLEENLQKYSLGASLSVSHNVQISVGVSAVQNSCKYSPTSWLVRASSDHMSGDNRAALIAHLS